MEQGNSRRDLGYYSVEIIKDKVGNPFILVKFKSDGKAHWARERSWCPTSEELEFLYRTMKWMEKSSSKESSVPQDFHVQEETGKRSREPRKTDPCVA